METDKFLKLKQGDQVVLNIFSRIYPENVSRAVKPRLYKARQLSVVEPALCEVLSAPTFLASSHPAVQVKLRRKRKPIFYVWPLNILRKATSEDLAAKPAVPATDLDLKVIEQTPGLFVQIECDYRWLPTHGKHRTGGSVRDRYNNNELSKQGGMLALLEYRSALCEGLLASVVPLTMEYSKRVRRDQVANDADLTAPEKAEYVDRVSPLVGNAPGSTQPSSDIDINSQGDGTEYAVCQFNALFRSAHDNNEPGIVFDVNIYGKDFLPSFKGWPDRGQTEAARLIRPCFDHAFTDYTIELEDADIQLDNAFVKLRRYMTEELWTTFVALLPSLETRLASARQQHLTWAFWIAQAYAKTVSPKDVKDPQPDIVLSGERFLAHENINPAKLMATQNRLYEYFLREKVEPQRNAFNLLKFKQSKKSNSAELQKAVDEAYKKLRKAMSESLYFANEAYVTAGAVLQTVGGKQKKSRGVEDLTQQRPHQHNIAYTPHELMASIIDQLADIHKEAGRHFAEQGKNEDIGGALIACGKYIHRLLNAAKHLYVLYQVGHVAGVSRGHPTTLFSSLDDWNKFRKLGFALEALKKLEYNQDELSSIKRAEFQTDYPADATNRNFDRKPVLWLLANKFSQTNQQLYEDFVGEKLTKEDVAERVVLNNPFGLLKNNTPDDHFYIHATSDFFKFFDSVAAAVLNDYLKLRPEEKPDPFARRAGEGKKPTRIMVADSQLTPDGRLDEIPGAPVFDIQEGAEEDDD